VTLDKVQIISHPTVVVAAFFCRTFLVTLVTIIIKCFFVHKIVDYGIGTMF